MSDEVQRSLGRIEGTLKAIQQDMSDASRRLETHMADDNKRLDDHDGRLRKAEKSLHVYATGSGVLGVIFAAVVDRFVGGGHS